MTRAGWNRLILIADPGTRHVIDVCTGPNPDGSCPRPVDGAPACRGAAILPVVGTEANGHAIPVTETADICPAFFVTPHEAVRTARAFYSGP